MSKSDKMRDLAHPAVFGHELDRATLTPLRKPIVARTDGGDHGADPLGDGRFRMVPSGDVVDLAERNAQLKRYHLEQE